MIDRVINIDGIERDGKFVVVLSADDGRREEKEFDTEEEARAAIDGMIAIARASEEIGKITIEEITR